MKFKSDHKNNLRYDMKMLINDSNEYFEKKTLNYINNYESNRLNDRLNTNIYENSDPSLVVMGDLNQSISVRAEQVF